MLTIILHVRIHSSTCKSGAADVTWYAPFNSIQDYLYSAFYDTIVAKKALQKIKSLQ